MISLVAGDPKVSDALQRWRERRPMPTALRSLDLRALGSQVHLQSVTSARLTNAQATGRLAQLIDEGLAGTINRATFVWQMRKEIVSLGYTPERGFPGEEEVPPAERGTLRDLTSERRLRLIWDTNMAIARNYGRVIAGNTEAALYAFPAWQLVRLYTREVPRGTPESGSVGWERRWHDAGVSVGWVGALGPGKPMIALKDSPIWQALGDGVGGYEDCLGHPFPPFAFNSGYDWRAVPRRECIDIELISIERVEPKPRPMPALAPAKPDFLRSFRALPTDIQEALRAKWAA